MSGTSNPVDHTLNIANYRWPAEWEPHAGTWVSWPINPNTWPGIFELIPPAFAKFVAAMARFEPVNVLATAATAKTARPLIDVACEAMAARFEVRLIDIEINDSWCRDYGPIFLNRTPSATNEDPPQIAIDWDYNAWGGKYPPWDKDAAAAKQICQRLGVATVRPKLILEGGAIEGNGAGVVMTTENCLLNPNRNPELSRFDMESVLKKYLNTQQTLWLPGHGILGDDTDGHIDQVSRFVSEDTVLVAAPFDDDSEEAADLRDNASALQAASEAMGLNLNVIPLPLPEPKFQQGHRLPACYCNFYIVNNGVVVPAFGDPADETALQILQSVFPERTIVGIDAIDLIWGLGAFHCMTQQQPQVTA